MDPGSSSPTPMARASGRSPEDAGARYVVRRSSPSAALQVATRRLQRSELICEYARLPPVLRKAKGE
jgi:hypothetical protein